MSRDDCLSDKKYQIKINTMKCVLVGDNTAGKTSLILTQVTDEDLHDYFGTSIKVDGTNVDLHLWDTVEYNNYD